MLGSRFRMTTLIWLAALFACSAPEGTHSKKLTTQDPLPLNPTPISTPSAHAPSAAPEVDLPLLRMGSLKFFSVNELETFNRNNNWPMRFIQTISADGYPITCTRGAFPFTNSTSENIKLNGCVLNPMSSMDLNSNNLPDYWEFTLIERLLEGRYRSDLTSAVLYKWNQNRDLIENELLTLVPLNAANRVYYEIFFLKMNLYLFSGSDADLEYIDSILVNIGKAGYPEVRKKFYELYSQELWNLTGRAWSLGYRHGCFHHTDQNCRAQYLINDLDQDGVPDLWENFYLRSQLCQTEVPSSDLPQNWQGSQLLRQQDRIYPQLADFLEVLTDSNRFTLKCVN